MKRAAILLLTVSFAGTASAQRIRDDDPVWVPIEDEDPGNCAEPTFEQCSDPAWLYSGEPCAVVQNAPDSECAGLLYFDLDARAESGEEETFIIARNLEATGVGAVIRTPAVQLSPEPEYVPDLYSLASKKAGADYVGTDQVGIDLFAFWDANGDEVESCREYAYEKFYDINEYQRHIGNIRDEYGEAFNDAYSSANNDYAIGTRHLYNENLRGKDGRSFGKLFRNIAQAKNELFRIRNNPASGGEAGVGVGGPGLLTSLAAFDQATAARLEKISDHKAGNAHLVAKTWAWQKDMKQLLSYEPADDDAPLNLNQLLAPNQNNQGLLLDNLNYADGPQVRKRLFEELDELYDLQQRVRKLQVEWGEIDGDFIDSGWTIEGAGLEDDAPNLFNLQLNPIQISPQNLNLAPNDAQQGPVPLPQPPDNYQAADIETARRLAVLEEMVDLLAIADAEGCLEDGATPCDWSPKAFVKASLVDFSGREDDRFEWCEDFTGGAVSNVLNLDLELVPDPFYCDVVTGDSITAAGLDALEVRVEECRLARIEYEKWVAEEEAKNRVREIPELVDPSTGQFVMPGIDKSRDEYMGNKYFGLGYDYAFGFGMDIQAEVCSIQMHAGGHLLAYTRVFGLDVPLLDAAANADTVEQGVHVHGRILGIELFEGIDEGWDQEDTYHFDIVRTPNKKKEQTIIDTTIVVVVVPIGIELGISGEIGAKLGLTVDATGLAGMSCPSVVVGGLVEPYLGVSGFVSAAIDIFIAAAGVRGEVNIITVSLPFKPGIGLSVIGDMNGDILPDGLELVIKATLDLVLETLSGRIWAFAEIGFCPFCYTGEFTIVKWTGPQWVQPLFDQTYTINLADLDAAFN